MFLLRARMAVVLSPSERVYARVCVNRPSWLFNDRARKRLHIRLIACIRCVSRYIIRARRCTCVHSPCEYVCAHRRRHRISACVYTVLCVCVGLYTCVHGDVRKAFKSMPNIGVTQCSSVFAKRRVCYSLHAAEATCPSTIMVVVRVCRSELRGVVQDASERRSSITKLDHSRFDYSSQPTS